MQVKLHHISSRSNKKDFFADSCGLLSLLACLFRSVAKSLSNFLFFCFLLLYFISLKIYLRILSENSKNGRCIYCKYINIYHIYTIYMILFHIYLLFYQYFIVLDSHITILPKDTQYRYIYLNIGSISLYICIHI